MQHHRCILSSLPHRAPPPPLPRPAPPPPPPQPKPAAACLQVHAGAAMSRVEGFVREALGGSRKRPAPTSSAAEQPPAGLLLPASLSLNCGDVVKDVHFLLKMGEGGSEAAATARSICQLHIGNAQQQLEGETLCATPLLCLPPASLPPSPAAVACNNQRPLLLLSACRRVQRIIEQVLEQHKGLLTAPMQPTLVKIEVGTRFSQPASLSVSAFQGGAPRGVT